MYIHTLVEINASYENSSYESSLTIVAFLIRDMEKEKMRLSLKHLPLKRLDKIVARLQELLDRVPQGEALYR